MAKIDFKNIDEYIDTFPKDVQEILEKIRNTIKKAVPKVQETISYQMPTFKLNGKNMVHFAGYKNHIGFYPTPSGLTHFTKSFPNIREQKVQ